MKNLLTLSYYTNIEIEKNILKNVKFQPNRNG
jgi:hypothetical protein